MGIAALVLGIIGIICMFLVVLAPIGFILVVIGLILGIVDVVKKGKTGGKKGIGIAGIIICAICTVVLLVESIIVIASVAVYSANSKAIVDKANTAMSEQEKMTFNQKFESYEGPNRGSSVKTLLRTISTNNIINDDKQVTCKLDGVSGDASSIINQIMISKQYQVTLHYNLQGYVNSVDITTSTSSSY